MNGMSPPNGPIRLAVLLHGVGSDSRSMAGLAAAIRTTDHSIEVVTPDAPHAFDLGDEGHQWFSIRGVSARNRAARVAAALPELRTLIDQELAARDFAWHQLAVIGFSQGAMMALALLHDGPAPARIAALSGRMVLPPRPELASASQIRMEHGLADQTISARKSEDAHHALHHAGFDATLTLIEGQEHEITNQQHRTISEWLTHKLDVDA